MRIACIGYRDWALKIYDQLASQTDHQFLVFRSKRQYDKQTLVDFKPDMVLFYGWSWIISSEIIEEFKCVMLHPSPLPKYRGGSPLQNQIISGETKSAVSLFLMDEGVDTGPILTQKEISLEGGIDDIFGRLSSVGLELTLKLLVDGLNPTPQDDEYATSFRRRKPEDSEITTADIQSRTAEYLYNKIRMLQAPYPNAFIRTSDGKKLVLIEARIAE